MDEIVGLLFFLDSLEQEKKRHLGGICSGSASLGTESWYCDADEKGLGWGCALQIYGSWSHDVELRLLQDFLSYGCTLHPFTGWSMALGVGWWAPGGAVACRAVGAGRDHCHRLCAKG